MRKLLVYSCNILVVVPKHLNITLISLGLAVWLQYWPIGHSPFFWYLTLCVVLSIIEWVQTYIYERVVVHHHLYPYSPCSSLINDLYILCRLFSLPSSPNLCHLFLLMITYASHTKEWSMLEKHSYIAMHTTAHGRISNPEPHASSWSLNPPKSSVMHYFAGRTVREHSLNTPYRY